VSRSLRMALFVFVSIALGVLAGFIAGNHNYSTEHSCPPRGGCPQPFTATRFHWGWALGVGAVATILLLAFLVLTSRASKHIAKPLEWD